MSDAVLTERRGHVLLVTINREDARNAINLAVSDGVGEAIETAENDPEIRAVVITGAGTKSFSAGADLKSIMRGEPIVAPERAHWGFAGIVQHATSKPVIAAVNGTALGGGTEIALSCDLVVACESASFGLPEVKRGLYAAAGGVFRLPRQIPHKIAMELIFTGDPISATDAATWGLVNKVVPDGTVVEAALELADRIAANAPLAVQASKRIAYGGSDESGDWAKNLSEMGVFGSEDAMEGPTAFAEKRAPVWKAR